MKPKNSLLLKVLHYSKQPFLWVLLYALLTTGWIVYQQFQIDELTERINTEHTMDHEDTFHYRITNLEHISNAHGDRLKELEQDSWQLKRFANQHQFRIMQLEWQHPGITAPAPSSATPVDKPFKANPTNTPDPK